MSEVFDRYFSLSPRGSLGVPIMYGRLLGSLLVPLSVQPIPQVCVLAQPSKDVARATFFVILVEAYTSGASPHPQGGWHVGACDLSPQVGTCPLGPYSHRVFIRHLRLFGHQVFTRTSSPQGFQVFTHLL